MLPKLCFFFFSLEIKLKDSLKTINLYFTSCAPYVGQNTLIWLHGRTYTFFNIFLCIIHSKRLHKLTYKINPNNPLWSHTGVFIIHPFWQNSHDIHFETTNITDIHNPSNLSQMNIFDSKLHLTYAWSWNPRLWPYHVHMQITLNWFKKNFQVFISLFYTKKKCNNLINKLSQAFLIPTPLITFKLKTHIF